MNSPPASNLLRRTGFLRKARSGFAYHFLSQHFVSTLTTAFLSARSLSFWTPMKLVFPGSGFKTGPAIVSQPDERHIEAGSIPAGVFSLTFLVNPFRQAA